MDIDARHDGSPETHPETVSGLDLDRMGRLSAQQSDALRELHKPLVEDLKTALTRRLEAPVEVEIASIAHEAMDAFIGRVGPVSYLAAIDVAPLNECALIHLDGSVSAPLVDLMLGGSGPVDPAKNALTEVDAEILADAVGMIAEAVQRAWASPSLNYSFAGRQDAVSLQPAPGDRMLVLSFGLVLAGVSGQLRLGLGPVLADRLFRKILAPAPEARRTTKRPAGAELRQRLLQTVFTAELVLPTGSIGAMEILSLEVGQVLPLPQRLDTSAWLVVGGRKMFSAMPVSCEQHRGAQIGERAGALPATSEDQE